MKSFKNMKNCVNEHGFDSFIQMFKIKTKQKKNKTKQNINEVAS